MELSPAEKEMKSSSGMPSSAARVNHGFEEEYDDNALPGPPYYRIAIDSSLNSKAADKAAEDAAATGSEVAKGSDCSSNIGEETVFCGLTKSKFLLIFVLCLADFLSLACSSLHAPFYPRVAIGKGASLTAAGFVFGIFQLTVFIACLFYGSLLAKVGPKRMAMWGIMAMGVASIAFGFLDNISDPTAFIALSFIIRIIQANGNAAFVTSSFAIIANEFPQNVAKAISYMETASGLGLIVGPAVGSGLYEAGGFILPFLVMGVLLLTAGILTHFWAPTVVVPEEGGVSEGEKPRGMISLLMIPTVALAAFSILAGSSAIGYLLPTLEPHVHENFDVHPSFTGLIFVIDGTMYALFNPMWGYLCDKFRQPRVISLIGSTCIFLGFLVIGPVPILPFTPVLWVTCIGCGIFGFGLGGTFVSGFVQALTDAMAKGFPDDVGTYGLVSGMWFSMMSLGCFVGSSVGGALTDNYSFEHGSYFVLFLQAFVAVWTIAFIIIFRKRKAVRDVESSSECYTQKGEVAET